jgi:hypothetical protein
MKPILPFIHQDDPRGLRGPKTWENHHNYEPHPMYPYEAPLESIQNERWRETSPTWFARTTGLPEPLLRRLRPIFGRQPPMLPLRRFWRFWRESRSQDGGGGRFSSTSPKEYSIGSPLSQGSSPPYKRRPPPPHSTHQARGEERDSVAGEFWYSKHVRYTLV